MNREDIIRMAQECGCWETDTGELVTDEIQLGRFAALVASAEREACAKVADTISDKYGWGHYGNEVDTADEIANAIRARGNTKQFEPCPFIECDCDGNHPLNQPAIRARGQE